MSCATEYPKALNSKLTLPDLNEMKKTILTEIGGVTQ